MSNKESITFNPEFVPGKQIAKTSFITLTRYFVSGVYKEIESIWTSLGRRYFVGRICSNEGRVSFELWKNGNWFQRFFGSPADRYLLYTLCFDMTEGILRHNIPTYTYCTTKESEKIHEIVKSISYSLEDLKRNVKYEVYEAQE